MAALWPANVTGGAHVQDGIVSYIPDCSDIHYSAISASRAAQYDITTVHYVVDVSAGRSDVLGFSENPTGLPWGDGEQLRSEALAGVRHGQFAASTSACVLAA